MFTFEDLKRRLGSRLRQKRQDFATRSIHLVEEPLLKGLKLRVGPHDYEVPEEAFLVVVDEAPGAFWTHPVRYELHHVENGETTVIPEQYPLEDGELKERMVAFFVPDLPHLRRDQERGLFEPPRASGETLEKLAEALRRVSFGPPRPCTANRHALFVAGVDNMPHFHTDFVMMREVLMLRYGYDPNNIVIVMGDGLGYPDLPVDYPGTVAGLDSALDAYAAGGAKPLGAGDTLFLFGFNHGGLDGGHATLCMEPAWDSYYDYQLRAKLDNIHCGELLVAMNQCHSGGFIDDVLASTGPGHIAIMTACREDQSAWPSAGGGDHGYLAAALGVALHWEFPLAVDPTFPGYAAGPVTIQDTNTDGMVSFTEAWQYVHDMMFAHHHMTIGGWETPQWGESSAGIGAGLYWGRPDVVVEDSPMPSYWESPDVYLHDPTALPTDATAVAGHPDNWGDFYHPDTTNRVVCRVHNAGCAPCRDINVELRVMSFGAGGGTTLIGSYPIAHLDPGEHAFAYVDWHFPSTLLHRCVMARADCPSDPAEPYGGAIVSDDNQAMRNLDPLFAGLGTLEPQILERTITIGNPVERAIDVILKPLPAEGNLDMIRPNLRDLEKRGEIHLKPKEEIEVPVLFEVAPKARRGEVIRQPIEIRGLVGGRERPLGGVTLAVKVATGTLVGSVLSGRTWPASGRVIAEGIKQPSLRYGAEVGLRGTFEFVDIVPGPYRLWAECGRDVAQGSVFVLPEAVTRTRLQLEKLPKIVHGVLEDEHGKLLDRQTVELRRPGSDERYLVQTDAEGRCSLAGVEPGEVVILVPGRTTKRPLRARLELALPEKKVETSREEILEREVVGV